MKGMTFSAAVALCLGFLAPALEAQVRVDLRIPRRLYVAYEPVTVIISITNMAGRDITLQDGNGEKWCNFEIQTEDGRLIPPRNPDQGLNPITIPAGETVKRSANLSALYPIGEFGMYRVRASVYFADAQKFFGSPTSNIEISEGKLIWQQTVGVPDGKPGAGGLRTLSLLTFRLERDNRLYVRVEDKDAGIVYATQQLGPILTNNPPTMEIDRANQLHILQLVGLQTYLYTRVGLNGETLAQLTYNSVNSRPKLRKREDGEVVVAGGQADIPVTASDNPVPAGPKLSDRPAGMPAR